MITVVLVVSLVLMVGCGDNGNNENETQDNNNDAEAAYPMSFVDDKGDTVEIEAEPQRIISLMPNLTETLFALGLGERVVGVTDLCDYPAEVADIERVGTAWMLNAEVILAAEPDLILTSEGTVQQDALDIFKQNGIAVAEINPKNLDEIIESFRRVAKIANVLENGEALADEVQAAREAFLEKVATATAAGDQPRVFFMIDEELFTVGDGVFMNEMIALAGGINAAATYGESWFQVSEEVMLEMDPEVIITSFVSRDDILSTTAWQNISAVQNERVFNINDDVVSRPGPRIVEGLEELYNAFFE